MSTRGRIQLRLALRNLRRQKRRSVLSGSAMVLAMALLVFSRAIAEGGHEDWIDAYVAYAKANNMLDRLSAPTAVKTLDIGIPDSAIQWNGIPVIHNPTFDDLDTLGYGGGTPWAKRCYGLSSKTWKLIHPESKFKHFSAPMDPADQRFSRMSLDTRLTLLPTKISGNFLNSVAYRSVKWLASSRMSLPRWRRVGM